MKKRIISSACALALAIGMVGAPVAETGVFTSLSASADRYWEYTSGDYVYEYHEDGKVVLIKYLGSDKNVTVPATIDGRKVTELFDTFKDNTDIESVVVPEGITFMEGVFKGCTSLKSVKLPKSLRIIYYSVFWKCKNLTTVDIPEGVTEIYGDAFFGCGVTSLTIPSTVTHLADGALECAEDLKTVYWLPTGTDVLGELSPGNEMTTYMGYTYDTGKYVKIPGFTIYGSKGTDLEAYAKERGFTYKYLEPDNVTGMTAAATGRNAIQLKWNKVSGATGYVVYKYNPTLKKYERYSVTSSNVQMVGGLSSGTTYAFTARAYKTINGKNYYSPSYSHFFTSTLPENVSGTKPAATGQTAIKLTWNKTVGATGYLVYQYVPSTRSYKIVGNTKTNVQMVTGLTAGTTYTFTVRAYRTYNGKNLYSPGYTNFTTSTVPNKVTFAATSNSRRTATVKWNKVGGAMTYVLYYKTSPSGSWGRVGEFANTTDSFTWTGLRSGSTVYFTVRAFRKVGGVYFGSPSFDTKYVVVK